MLDDPDDAASDDPTLHRRLALELACDMAAANRQGRAHVFITAESVVEMARKFEAFLEEPRA